MHHVHVALLQGRSSQHRPARVPRVKLPLRRRRQSRLSPTSDLTVRVSHEEFFYFSIPEGKHLSIHLPGKSAFMMRACLGIGPYSSFWVRQEPLSPHPTPHTILTFTRYRKCRCACSGFLWGYRLGAYIIRFYKKKVWDMLEITTYCLFVVLSAEPCFRFRKLRSIISKEFFSL